jgi:3-dehydroquinate synthase
MTKQIRVSLGKRSYPIVIAEGAIRRLPELTRQSLAGYNTAYIVTNHYLYKKYGVKLSAILKGAKFFFKFRLIPDSEAAKTLPVASAILADLAAFSRKQRVFILAFGGGVVGDLAGFVACIYRRGIPYIQAPTTLLAQVDSAIGGKTAVDLRLGKNLVGAFYQPRLVISDTDFLCSLDSRQLRSGLAEVIKYGLIKDRHLFAYLERNLRHIVARDRRALEFIIGRCSAIKAAIVSQDEREEKKIRTILNFGHTLGHAIETAGRFRLYSHGEAIALGMLAAGELSLNLKLMCQNDFFRMQRLISLAGLPTRLKKLKPKDIIQAHYQDKKFIGSRNRLVLLRGIGQAIVRDDIALSLIRKAVAALLA